MSSRAVLDIFLAAKQTTDCAVTNQKQSLLLARPVYCIRQAFFYRLCIGFTWHVAIFRILFQHSVCSKTKRNILNPVRLIYREEEIHVLVQCPSITMMNATSRYHQGRPMEGPRPTCITPLPLGSSTIN